MCWTIERRSRQLRMQWNCWEMPMPTCPTSGESVITSINKSLLPIVGDDSNFAYAAPLLFGTEFAKKGKEMMDQVKAMRSTVSRKPDRRPFFRGGPPSNRGDFTKRHSVRGGAQSFHYRVRPYQGGKAQTLNRGTRTQN